ncbi:MAG TPA: mandelate racemase/muconate lactonizing enzyme family protein [Candidatus Tectomicrobia bacterium]|nr:mandelate racemase/muconate lactonizing enzyme family protein [Candidatus Tectomicrobia bacterium]
MKITAIETFVVDAGWRPWQFVAVRTDAGITGYGECSDGRNPYGVVSTVQDFAAILLGRDPRPVEMRYWDMYRMARQSAGGIAAKAIAGIELALWDIKAKALGVPVYELFGGPLRTRQLVYWSHCGTSRATSPDLIGVEPLRTMEDVARLGEEVVRRGFRALKTNIVYPGDPARVHFTGFGGGPGTTDQTLLPGMLEHIQALLATFRRAVGPGVGLALDLNFNFKPEAARRICRALEPLDMMWVELDLYDPRALREVKESTAIPICSGENLYGLREYRPFFEARALDVVMVDVPWNGFAVSRRVADLAESYELNVAPHNYYSHLATLHAAHLCACAPNVRIMEIDVDDVPWKDELVDRVPAIEAGELVIPTRPGWGADLVEDVARKHRWEPGRLPGYVDSSMYRR